MGWQGESQLLGFCKDENASVMPSEYVRPRGGAQPEEVWRHDERRGRILPGPAYIENPHMNSGDFLC
jgi:hypothetical protein